MPLKLKPQLVEKVIADISLIKTRQDFGQLRLRNTSNKEAI